MAFNSKMSISLFYLGNIYVSFYDSLLKPLYLFISFLYGINIVQAKEMKHSLICYSEGTGNGDTF